MILDASRLGATRLLFAALGVFSASALASPAVTLTDANDASHPITYTSGPYLVRNADTGCVPQVPTCDDTALTIDVSAATAQNSRAVVRVDWPQPVQADFDLVVKQGANTVASSASTTDPEIAHFDAVNGLYNVHVDAYQPFGNSITVKIFLEPKSPTPPAPVGPAARYQVYAPSAALGANGGEPSLGTNWKTGTTVVGNTRQAFFISWDDTTSPAKDTWVNRAPRTNVISFDPILFTDHETGHTVVSQLVSDVVAFTIGCSLSSVTDDDGLTWIPAEGCGPPAGADHQGIGGGPYHAPFPTLPSPAPHAVYYCAQSISGVLGDATCSRSDDGGLTYGPGILVYTSECGGIHGHPRVAPDGTVYLPNKDCSGAAGLNQGVVVSADNGLTWTVRTVPGTSAGESDPSVATGLNNIGKPAAQTSNTVYLGMCDGDGLAKVAVSRNLGASWSPAQDVGVSAGIKNCAFPEMIAGDDDRAAMMFIGTPTAGAFQSGDFRGEWHAYVATTYDGGATWGLYDATPDDPVQVGPICQMGIACNGFRNLLDFNDISLDKQGRPNFVFTDGCVTPACGPGASPATSNKALETVGRQSGGKTLFSAFDAAVRVLPGAPRPVSASRAADQVAVNWLAPDNGGSPLTAYRVYRGATPGQEQLIATISPTKPQFLDSTAATGSFFYKVSAINANGEGEQSPEFAIAGQDGIESACVAPGVTVVTDGDGDELFTAGPVGPQSDIQRVRLGEPFTSATDKFLLVTMKVQNLATPLQPNTEWKVFFTVNDTNGTPRELFVEMDNNDLAETKPVFNYGWTDRSGAQGSDISMGSANVTGSYSADGTITIKFKIGAISFNNFPSGHAFDVNIDKGSHLSNIGAATLVEIGAVVAGTGGGELLTSDSTSAPGDYTLKSNYFCRPNHPPVALLATTPASGVAPLNVSFDGSGSSDQDADAISVYAYDFGDGSAPVSSGSAAVTHVYAAGNYTASLVVTDERGLSSLAATQPITVAVPVRAVNDAYTVKTGAANVVLSPLVNDSSPAATPTIIGVGARSKGGAVTIGSGGTTLVYTPKAAFSGVETFSYTIGAGGGTSTATITVTVRANRVPVAKDHSFTIAKNSAPKGLAVLSGDTDPDRTNTPPDTLKVKAVGARDHGGTVTIPASGANVVYQPAHNFAGVETFTYTIVDNSGATATAKVTVTVQ